MITYLQVDNLSKYWGELTLFEGISFSVSEGQKVAMIAKNGAGKSTLMDIIAGLETPDGGKSMLMNPNSIGYLRQNPDLNPEVSDTWETGFDLVWKGLNSAFTWFTTDYTGMIETKATAANTFTYKNIGSAKISGIESGLSWKMNHSNAGLVFEPYLNYTFLVEHKDNDTGKDLLYTPEWNASTGLRVHDTKGFSGALNITCTGKSMIQDYENSWSGPVVSKGGFAVTNVSASKKFPFGHEKDNGRGLTMKVDIDNLFDRQYQHVKGYTMPGRAVVFGLRADI